MTGKEFVLKRIVSPRRLLVSLHMQLHVFLFCILTPVYNWYLVFKRIYTCFDIRKCRSDGVELALNYFWFFLYRVFSIFVRLKVIIVHIDVNYSVMHISFWFFQHFGQLCLIVYIVNQTTFILVEFVSLPR